MLGIAPWLKMHTTNASHQRGRQELLKFVHHCIRYAIVSKFVLMVKHCGAFSLIKHLLMLVSLSLQYIRKLLFADLDEPSFDHVLKQLRKLPWSECEQYLLNCFMKVHKGKYSQVHLIASLTACLSRYHEAFSIGVVDEVSYLNTFIIRKKNNLEKQNLVSKVQLGEGDTKVK